MQVEFPIKFLDQKLHLQSSESSALWTARELEETDIDHTESCSVERSDRALSWHVDEISFVVEYLRSGGVATLSGNPLRGDILLQYRQCNLSESERLAYFFGFSD